MTQPRTEKDIDLNSKELLDAMMSFDDPEVFWSSESNLVVMGDKNHPSLLAWIVRHFKIGRVTRRGRSGRRTYDFVPIPVSQSFKRKPPVKKNKYRGKRK